MMRTHELWAEAFRDVVSGTSRTLVFMTLSCALLCTLVLSDAMTIGALVREAREYQAKGASVITVTAPSGIDGLGCERLEELPSVQAAGALRSSSDSVVAGLLPAAPLPLYEVTPGMLDVLGADARGAGGVSVPTDVVAALGVRVGDSFEAVDGAAIPVDGTYTYPSDGRRPGFGWALLATMPSVGKFDECWVTVWPSQPELRSLVLSSAVTLDFSARGGQPLESQLNTQLGTSFDGYARFIDRATRFVPFVALFAGLALGLLSVRLRRLELAARLHDGFGRGQLLRLVSIEGASWFVPSAVICAAVGALHAAAVGFPDAMSILSVVIAVAVLGAIGAAAGTLVGVSLVREHHLFAYFKDR